MARCLESGRLVRRQPRAPKVGCAIAEHRSERSYWLVLYESTDLLISRDPASDVAGAAPSVVGELDRGEFRPPPVPGEDVGSADLDSSGASVVGVDNP